MFLAASTMRMGMVVAMVMPVVMSIMIMAVTIMGMVCMTVISMVMVCMTVISMVMAMIGVGPDTPDVVMMPLLFGPNLRLVSQDLRSILAELAIHRWRTFEDFTCPVGKRIEHQRVIAQIRRLNKIDLRK